MIDRTESAVGRLRDAPWVSEETHKALLDLVRRCFALVDGEGR